MLKNVIRSILENFPSFIIFLRSLRDLLDQRNPSKMTPWGFTLAGHKAMAMGIFEPQETKLVRNELQGVDVLVNVGANVGYYCCHALSMGKLVVAFEPLPRNLHYLFKNISNNGWATKAQVFPVALGRETNILEMWGGGTGASLIKGWASIPDSYMTKVSVLNLDRVLGNTLNGKRALILVDIEGAELMMLQGASQTLTNSPRPIWIVEITASEHQPAGISFNPHFLETFEIFLCLGYRAYTADELMTEVTLGDVKEFIENTQKLPTHNFMFK